MKPAKNAIRTLSLLALAAGLLALVGTSFAEDCCPCRTFTTNLMQGSCRGFSSTASNPFFILKPGFQATIEGTEDGVLVRLVITVLDETLTIQDIETRVVEERETEDGELVEVSRNYFATCKRNNSVFYFGEDTDIYENGVIVSHEGSWRAGVNGARAGVIMPGIILNGAKYFQEIAPEVALDQAETVRTTETVTTPAETFRNWLKTKETTPLEPDAVEYKFYARGIGLVQDDVLKLVSFSTMEDGE